MVYKKAHIRLIWSKAIVSAWPHGAKVCDWSDHRRAHIGDTKNRHKTCVHQISEISLMKQVQVWLHAVMLVQGCVVVDQWCRGSNGKAKIEGHMWVSDEAHWWVRVQVDIWTPMGTPLLFTIWDCQHNMSTWWIVSHEGPWTHLILFGDLDHQRSQKQIHLDRSRCVCQKCIKEVQTSRCKQHQKPPPSSCTLRNVWRNCTHRKQDIIPTNDQDIDLCCHQH